MNETSELAVLAIGQVASMALADQIVAVGGSVANVRDAVEGSVYWPQFCELVTAGHVTSEFIPGPLGTAVVGWATTGAGPTAADPEAL